MLIAMGSWRGSPGATTAALALAEAWPTDQRTYVAECDPHGGTLVTRFLLPGPRRLAQLAGQSRNGGDLSLFDEYAVAAPSGVRLLTGPEDGRRLRAALRALLAPGGLFEQAADDPNTVVLADVGRVNPESPETTSLLLLADMLLLVARPVPDQILTLSGAREQARGLHPQTALLLIGPGYPAGQVAEVLDLPVIGSLPLLATGAAAVWERLSRRNAFAAAANRVCRALLTPVQVPGQRSGPARPMADSTSEGASV